MTKPTVTQSNQKFGIFRGDAIAFTEASALRGKTYDDRVAAVIAMEDLRRELAWTQKGNLEVREIKV